MNSVRKRLGDLAGWDLLAALLREPLDNLAELRLHLSGQLEPGLFPKEIRHAALAGLAVHADDRRIVTPNVLRVDGMYGTSQICSG